MPMLDQRLQSAVVVDPDSMLHTCLSYYMCVCLAWLYPSKAQTTQLPCSAGDWLMLWRAVHGMGWALERALAESQTKAKCQSLIEHQCDQQ